MGEMVNFDSGDERYEGYLAVPSSGRGAGVIVIQEYWGLVGHIKSVADRFAGAGFTALAPDLYKGKQADEPDEAGKMMMALDIEEVAKVLSRAAEWLVAQDSVSGEKVGVVGFCMGGQLSLFTACLSPHIGACVDFYGIHPNVKPDFSKLQAPVMGNFAEHDEYTPPEVIAALDAQLTQLGKAHDFKTYPGTHHAFFNDDRPEVYDAEAAADAWGRVVGFFGANLK